MLILYLPHRFLVKVNEVLIIQYSYIRKEDPVKSKTNINVSCFLILSDLFIAHPCQIITDHSLDKGHDGHGRQYDGPGEHEEGAGEGVKGRVVHQGVERAGEEGGEGAHQGQAGEDPPHLTAVHTLAEQPELFEIVLFGSNLKNDLDREYFG